MLVPLFRNEIKFSNLRETQNSRTLHNSSRFCRHFTSSYFGRFSQIWSKKIIPQKYTNMYQLTRLFQFHLLFSYKTTDLVNAVQLLKRNFTYDPNISTVYVSINRINLWEVKFFSLMGSNWVHLVLRPLFSLLHQPKKKDDCGAIGGMRIGRGNRCTRRNPFPMPLCPPQILHELTLTLTRTAAVIKPATNRLNYPTASQV
jgi:hypothetical protein